MKKEDLRKAWITAAVISGAIISAIFVYALVVEIISRILSFKPLLAGPGAAAVRYAFYIAGAGSVFALKFIRPAMELVYFPRYQAWEEKLRGVNGLTLE